jgi:DNA-binding LacI/PurR family transcriptional regulator
MKPARENSPTIYDVAAQSGLSISTVSRVLNSPERVNKATRAKVLAAIDELGFVPRAEARARALHNNRRIGVVTPFFTAPSFVQRLRGIDSLLVETSYELVIYTVDSLARLQGYLATLPLTGNLDGLIIMSLPVDDAAVRRLSERGPETVSIEYAINDFCSVEIDDVAGGKMAAQYLTGKGHELIGFIGDIDPPDYAIRPVISRLEGFRQGLAEVGVALPDRMIRSSPYAQESTQKAAYELLSQTERPNAIFAAADIQAMSVLKVAREMRLKVPGDLSVIGFDDLDLTDYIGLTTIRQPLDDSGRIAAELLLSRQAHPSRPVQHVKLPLTIIERETV